MYDGRFRSKTQRARLRYSGSDDAVEQKRKEDGRSSRNWSHRVGGDGVRSSNVDGEKVTAMSGEVVVDSETALKVKRLRRCGLHNIGVGAQSTLGGARHFYPKICVNKKYFRLWPI